VRHEDNRTDNVAIGLKAVASLRASAREAFVKTCAVEGQQKQAILDPDKVGNKLLISWYVLFTILDSLSRYSNI